MSETLITAAIILGLLFFFIFLFVLHHKNGNKNKTIIQNIIVADIVWKNKLVIAEQEIINNYLVAIDRTSFVLLYINFHNEKGQELLIDLHRILEAKVTTEENSVYEQRQGKPILVDKQTSKLQMEISLTGTSEKTNLIFYEYKDGMQNLEETKRKAEDWKQKINSTVKELHHSSMHIKNVYHG